MAAEQQQVGDELREVLLSLPNRPNPQVPQGSTDEDNEFIRGGGEKPNLRDGAKPHWELAADYDIIDFELGVKLAGAGFPVYKGQGAKLQRALVSFFLDRGDRSRLPRVSAVAADQ